MKKEMLKVTSASTACHTCKSETFRMRTVIDKLILGKSNAGLV